MKKLTEKQKQDFKKNLSYLGASVFMGLLLMAAALPGTFSFSGDSSTSSYDPVDPVLVLGDKEKNRGRGGKENSSDKPDKDNSPRSEKNTPSRGNSNKNTGPSSSSNHSNNNQKEERGGRPEQAPSTERGNSGKENSRSQSARKEIKKDLEILPGEDVKAPRGQNAQVVKNKNREISQEIKAVAKKEKPEVAKKLESIAQQQEQTMEEAAESVEEIEKRGGFKRFLAGSDYKNLGQLRSSLVRNRNQIRQLTQTMQQMSDTENQAVIAEQIESLMQERERMRTVIEENQEGFSLLGWAFRFMNGYEEVDPTKLAEEEDELEEEIEEALEELEEESDEEDEEEELEEEIEEEELENEDSQENNLEDGVEVQGTTDVRSVFEE